MAHLWVPATGRADSGAEPAWAVVELKGPAFSLTGDPARPVAVRKEGRSNGAMAYILRRAEPGGAERWVLFTTAAGSRVHLNGAPLSIGIRVLRDRDELRVGSAGSMFFSAERLACVEAFPGIGKAAYCPRCKQEIPVGAPAVCCPACHVWHHQDSEKRLPCWTYAETCAADCGQRTELNARYQWTPQGGL